jgi:DNA repair protein RadB
MLYPSDCHNLDTLIGGGFPTKAISHVFGEPGSGKTTLGIQLAVNVIRREKRVIFVAADQFPGERFAQIAGTDVESISQRLLVFEVKSFDQQRGTLRNIKRMAKENVGLVVLDPATTHYRLEQSKNTESALQHSLVNQLLLLLGLAKKFDLSVVVTNQVYADIDTGEVLPVAGYLIDNLSKVVVQFAKTDGRRRCAIVKKHPTQPRDAHTRFKITGDGLTDA